MTSAPAAETAFARAQADRRIGAWPWWLAVGAVYLVARLISSGMLLALASVQGDNPWTGRGPGYFDYASIWDGTWYKIIAYAGYPRDLPLTPEGEVGENAWAFMPVYPFTVRGLMAITGESWEVISVLVSVLCGLGAVLLFYRLVIGFLRPGTALFAAVLFCVSPVSPLFQLAYAESLYLLLLVLALLLLLRRRYALLFPVVAVMALTRPSGLAFALCVLIHLVYRFGIRRRDPFPLDERVLAGGLAVFSGLAGLAWPAIAWAATGSLTAYTDTELAWRAPYVGSQHLIPFAPWFQGGNWWLGYPRGMIAVLVVLILFVVLLVTPAARRLPLDLRFWVVSYSLYVFAVFFPQSSVFRLLMPLFPLLAVFAQPRSRVYRVALVVVFLAMQWGWLLLCWGVDGSDWTPP